MDAETEVAKGAEGENMDTDDGFDTLVRKAVTVSQANLPLATINKDIDDIAHAYAKENDRPDNALGDDVLRLLERTRQRRELLDQHMGKVPEAAPRKRRSPLSEDLANVGSGSAQTEDSPKRQCVREKESAIKPDTPAIAGVKSRLQALSAQRSHWAEEGAENLEEPSPVPTPRKSLSSPSKEQAKPVDVQGGAQPGSQRKSRFAQLASNINSWEDDLSHPTIVKEEEKKPRWQPPKAEGKSASAQSSSSRSSHGPVPAAASSSSKSPRKSAASASSQPASSPRSSPTKQDKKTKSAASAAPAVRSPVKSSTSKGAESCGQQETREQKKGATAEKEGKVQDHKSSNTSRNVTEKEQNDVEMQECSAANKPEIRKDAVKTGDPKKGGVETPKVTMPPTDRPLSARLANWEQKISGSKTEAPGTPKSTLTAAGKGKDATAAHTVSTPAMEESEPVQMRPKARKTVEDEPTAHSVSARMSAWEHISSAQVVSDIKKVKPGDCTPVKTPATQKSPAKSGTGIPAKATSQDGIKDRIAHFNTPQKASGTPSKTPAVGSATKSAQWQLAQQSNASSMAERLRQERMAELQGIQNRWKNGILRDDKDGGTEQPPEPGMSAKKEKREAMRDKARADQCEAEPSVVSSKKDTSSNSDNRNVEVEKISQSTAGKEKRGSHSQVATAIERNVPTVEGDCTEGKQDRQSLESNTLKRKHENSDVSMCKENTTVHMVESSAHLGIKKAKIEQESSNLNIPEQYQETATVQKTNIDQNEAAAREHDERGGDECSARQAVSQSEEPMGCTDNSKENTGIGGHQLDNTSEAGSKRDCSEGNEHEDPLRRGESGSACAEEQKHNTGQLPKESENRNFENKLATAGLDVCGKDKADDCEGTAEGAGNTATAPSSSQPAPKASSAGSVVSGKPPRPTSLFSIVSQQKAEAAAAAATSSPRPVSAAATSKACRKVKFDDSFEEEEEDAQAPLPKVQATARTTESLPVAEEDKAEDAQEEEEEDMEVVLRRPRPGSQQQQQRSKPCEEDDVSLSAFVPRSVRFESILPSEMQDMDSSINSFDSFEAPPGAPPDFHKSTVDLVKLGQQYADSDSCSSLNTAEGTSQCGADPPQKPGPRQDMEESVDDRDAIGDLLDEAMDSDTEEAPSTSDKPPSPVMRKKNIQRKATGAGGLPFSINEYRASRNMQIQEVKQTIVRNSQYVGMTVKEEDVEMPTCAPVPAPRRSLQDRIKELQELVQQEQSIIMQTSNALNQCCSSASYFAGSSEQVECNRILLLACQKRQAYMTEIQRLKDSKVIDPSGPGPKGSLTISDIRLPLKKEFVTKIGTSQDTMTYYFILLLKNGPQVITTQMLSTHDPMMRGSLDFPNLIKINDITGSFHIQMDIYCMSVSCEASGKDKKKKTPKKIKGSALTVQSPGGPLAVRTTCFSQVTTVHLTMKSLDKRCFGLDRLSHLSPLHGNIYMNLKCLMEANVEEKGFLTMFEDVSGLGSWHRRWCVLSSNNLQFWKYPDDETKKDPMGYIDLKRCVTEKVGLISRDVCARPHTFELTSVRQPRKGEKDTLVSRTYSTMTTIRHMLSADTKEERIVWCNKINRALATIRTWHADAMRPIPK